MSPLYWFILAYLVVGIIVAVWILQKDNKEQRVDLKGKLHALSANLMGPWRPVPLMRLARCWVTSSVPCCGQCPW